MLAFLWLILFIYASDSYIWMALNILDDVHRIVFIKPANVDENSRDNQQFTRSACRWRVKSHGQGGQLFQHVKS